MKSDKVKKLTTTALLFAAAVILSLVELMFPLPGYGIKLGLANITVMYAMLAMDGRTAFSIGILKSLFVLITRGAVSAILSVCGFLIAFIAMMLLLRIFKDKIGYLTVSVAGALGHNAGQLIAVAFLYSPLLAYANTPLLGISAIVTGCITATLLRLSFKVLNTR